MSHFKKNWKIRMSTMTEQDFQQENGGVPYTQQSVNQSSVASAATAATIPTPPSSTQSQSITPPPPPHSSSSASSTSSTCSTNLKSLSPLPLSQQPHHPNAAAAAAAAAAAVAQLLAANGHSAKSLLTSKELAKLNLDVKNFKIDQFNPNFNDFNHQLSSQIESLYQQQQFLNNGSNKKANGNGVMPNGNHHRSRKQEHKKQHHGSDGEEDSLNLCLKQRRRNGDLIKGDSLSPSSPSRRGTESYSDEAHSTESPIKSETPSCSSSITNEHNGNRMQSSRHAPPSLHDQTTNEDEDCSNSRHDDSCDSPSSSRSISPSMTSSYREDNLTTPYANVDPAILSQLQNGGLSGIAGLNPSAYASLLPGLQGTPNGSAQQQSVAAAAASLANLAAAQNGNQSASRKRRNERDSSERNKKIKPVPDEKKDDAYWERRRKNNEAAKRSRDLRRQKEDEIAVRASFLEQENLKLRAQVTILKAELSKLHFMIYNR